MDEIIHEYPIIHTWMKCDLIQKLSHEMQNYIWTKLSINIQLSIDGWNGICPIEWMKK
jgi:hypothetical protein